MNPHAESWEQVRALLRAARQELGPVPRESVGGPARVGVLSGTLTEFEEFLDHNELELAWDALESVAEQVDAPQSCWEKLSRAADLMQLSEKSDSAARRARAAIPCDEALKIARLDAEQAYRDLSPYRILIVQELDGWHVDYELKNPRLNGGGPHYVIDAMTGAILSKVYEQ